jgi:hypothetical protein
MPSKKTQEEKAAPAAEAPKPEPDTKQVPDLTPDQAMVYAALGLGEQA